MDIDDKLDRRFKRTGATKGAMADALKYLYKDMAMTIESQEEALEYLDNLEKRHYSQLKDIKGRWWFKLFAKKKRYAS